MLRNKRSPYRRLKPEEKTMLLIFKWAADKPDINPFMHAVKNESKRTLREGALQKACGLRAGVPDIYLDIAVAPYHGLRIELKELSPTTGRWGTLSKSQRSYLERLNQNGYHAVCCKGYDDTIKTIENYLGKNYEGH